jgi:hypothetical protein
VDVIGSREIGAGAEPADRNGKAVTLTGGLPPRWCWPRHLLLAPATLYRPEQAMDGWSKVFTFFGKLLAK